MTEEPPATTALASRIRGLLEADRFAPGERIGSERALAERRGVPHSALHAALEQLEAEGDVQRRLGRTGGVFRNDGRILRRINTTLGVPEMVLRQGLTMDTRVLRAEIGLPMPDETRALQLGDDERVYRIVRLREVAGAPWSLDCSVLPASRFPALVQHDLTRSLYRILHDEYALTLDRAEESLEVSAADAAQATLLDIPVGGSLLRFHRIAWDDRDAPVEYALDHFRADRTRVLTREYGGNWTRVRRQGRAG
jgi:GntR family transcriptional regulator